MVVVVVGLPERLEHLQTTLKGVGSDVFLLQRLVERPGVAVLLRRVDAGGVDPNPKHPCRLAEPAAGVLGPVVDAYGQPGRVGPVGGHGIPQPRSGALGDRRPLKPVCQPLSGVRVCDVEAVAPSGLPAPHV